MKTFKSVKLGDKHEDVAILQALLRAMQYQGEDNKLIDVDGNAGKNTIAAINRFQTIQRSLGVECGNAGKNDGIFGSKCWQRVLGN